MPPFDCASRVGWSYRFLAVDLRAVDLRAVDFLLRAGDFRAVVLRAVDFLLRAGDFRAVDLRAVDLRAVDFRAVDFRAVDFRAVDFLLAVDLRAGDFLAVDFLRVDPAFRVPARLAVLFLAVDLFRAVAINSPPFSLSGRHPFQASPFPFAHPSPHSVPLVAAQRVVQALDPNGAVRADPFGLSRGATLLGEEDLRVVVPAPCPLLPRDEVMHRDPLPSESHVCNSEGSGGGLARVIFAKPLLPSSLGKILAVCARGCKGFPQKNCWSISLTVSVKKVDGIGGSRALCDGWRGCG